MEGVEPIRQEQPDKGELVRLKRHPFAVWTLAWSPDSAQIASAGQSREVWLWDASTLRTRLIVRMHTPGVHALAWSPDGTELAIGGQDGSISLWQTQTGAHLLTYALHRQAVSVLAWSPDGSQIASSSAESFLQIWKATTGERVFARRYGYERDVDHEVHALAWSPDGRYLAAGSWFMVLTLWEVRTGELVDWQWDEDHVLFADSLAWPTHGQRLLCTYSGAPLAFFKGERLFAHSHARTTEAITASPDGKYVALPRERDQAIRISQARWQGEVIFLYGGHRQRVTALDWSPDGKTIASASSDRTVHLWEPNLSAPQPPRPTAARLRVEGMTFDSETDYAAFARTRLLGSTTPPAAFPLEWFARVLPAFARSPLLDLLTEGLADCLTAPEPLVRAQALRFFQAHPEARGAERIAELVAGDRALFSGVANPLGGSADLEAELLETLGRRLAIRDERALEAAQAEVLTPGKALPLIAPLIATHTEWVIQHAEEIVAGTPEAGIRILLGLQPNWRGITKVGRRIAPLAVRDPCFLDDVEHFITDPDVKSRIVDAVKEGR